MFTAIKKIIILCKFAELLDLLCKFFMVFCPIVTVWNKENVFLYAEYLLDTHIQAFASIIGPLPHMVGPPEQHSGTFGPICNKNTRHFVFSREIGYTTCNAK